MNISDIKVGVRVETTNSGWLEVVGKSDKPDCKRGAFWNVKFDSTGVFKNDVRSGDIVLGCVRDGSTGYSPRSGDVLNTANDGQVEVIGYKSSREITVKFVSTDNEYVVQLDALMTGYIKDNKTTSDRVAAKEVEATEIAAVKARAMSIRRAAEILRKSELLARKVVDSAYRAERDAARSAIYEVEKARLESERLTAIENIKTPTITNPDESVKKVDILDIDFKDREGKWVLRYSDKKTHIFTQTRLGRLHNGVTQRANKDGATQNTHSKSYKGVSISQEWKDPQVFCDWAVQQHGWGLGYHLDKDLLVDGNREYSAQTCCFLPRGLNLSVRARYQVAPKKLKDGTWIAKIRIKGSEVVLGTYSTEKDALLVTKEAATTMLRNLIASYKDTISPAAYEKLINR